MNDSLSPSRRGSGNQVAVGSMIVWWRVEPSVQSLGSFQLIRLAARTKSVTPNGVAWNSAASLKSAMAPAPSAVVALSPGSSSSWDHFLERIDFFFRFTLFKWVSLIERFLFKRSAKIESRSLESDRKFAYWFAYQWSIQFLMRSLIQAASEGFL